MILDASATVTRALTTRSASSATFSTAARTSESLPTPDGSMMIRSGWYSSATFFSALPKSPTSEQQMQPEFISVMLIPASFKNPPSIPISPNSFSIRTIFLPANTSLTSFLISVVFPAPRNPEKMSTFVMSVPSFCSIMTLHTGDLLLIIIRLPAWLIIKYPTASSAKRLTRLHSRFCLDIPVFRSNFITVPLLL